MLPWAELQIVDEADNVLPAGQIGRVRVRSDEMVVSYAEDTDGAETPFKGGWFYPGDLGQLREDGLFVLEGRDDDVLNVGGTKLSALAVEEALLRIPEILEAAAFVLTSAEGTSTLCAAIVLHPQADMAAIAARAGQHVQRPIRLVGISAIPRNQMGKIRRRELKDAVQNQLLA